MKKLFALFVAAGILAFMACGGGADKEKEQKLKDSLKKDSIAKAEKAIKVKDSLKADSITKADTLKKEDPKKGPNQGPKDDKNKGDRTGGTKKQ
ncbi:MAG: hypothetical protein V1904_07205 [Bacteroidota bacterium]